jgi:autotransporter family porin
MMSRSTISTTLHSTVTLGTDGYAPDLTFTSKGGDTPTLSGHSAVVIDAPGGSLNNAGALLGAANVDGNAGAGGIGIRLTSVGTVDNTGTVSGGRGGSGVDSGFSGPSSGKGGDGIALTHGGVIKNGGEIVGGEGGTPAVIYKYGYSYSIGRGGNGGAGILMTGGTVLNQGSIEGGYGFQGGSGGDGVSVSGAGTVVNTGMISGGYGGSNFKTENAGDGGIGAVVASQCRLTNYGLIIGGGGVAPPFMGKRALAAQVPFCVMGAN